MPPGSGRVTVSRSKEVWFTSVIVADTSVVLSRSVMVVSVSAIGVGGAVFREDRPERGSRRSGRVIGIEVDHRRAVVHRLDLDQRRCDVAVDGAVIDDNLDGPGDVRRIGAVVVEFDLLQRELIVELRGDARERDGSCARAGNRDAGRRCSDEGQNVVGLRVGQRDRGRGEVEIVVVDDQNVGIHDGDRRRRPR